MSAAADLKSWKRKRVRAGVVMMPVGVALVITGSALAWGTTALVGFAVGAIGLVAIVVGALLIRQAVAGPFPIDVEGFA